MSTRPKRMARSVSVAPMAAVPASLVEVAPAAVMAAPIRKTENYIAKKESGSDPTFFFYQQAREEFSTFNVKIKMNGNFV